MAGITLEQAEAKLQKWLDADDAVVSGQSYSISGRHLTRADSAEIRKNILFWEKRVKRLSGGGISVKRVTPI